MSDLDTNYTIEDRIKAAEDARPVPYGDYRKLESQLAALKEENERLKGEIELADKCRKSWKDAACQKVGEAELLKARVAELEAETVQSIANKVCLHLPERSEIMLCMENGSASVEFILNGKRIYLDWNDKTLIEQINEALCIASELSKEPANEG